jgi:Phosphate-induced protein 1 conserved region
MAALAALASLSIQAIAGTDDDGEHGLGAVLHRNSRIAAAAPTAGSTAAVTPLITYHGGALIQSPVVYVIWYGNWNSSNGSDTPAGQQIVRDFLNSIGGSPYFNINKTYSTNAYTITGNVTFGGEYAEPTSATATSVKLTDTGVLNVINTALVNKKLPYDPNGVYFVLTSSANVSKSGFCTSYCGWHTSGNATAGKVRYSFVGNANKCINSCAAQSAPSPNGNPGVDGMISVIAHELEETTTDADPSSGYVDSKGAENGDKCAWTFGTTQTTSTGAYYNVTLGARKYLIQRNLIRASDGNNYCVMQ